ncbi:MAG: hypothetical protein C6P37_14220 [Caldibacillus debilis]|uniref:Uncharacterized protein n=1 Tax=Caldibacillus debilis TaxID=301148 RepID=A0A3E0JZM6_9BACI|nr:MAG: hypothetical protein C6P37_14220 [Caldibacillus debilis]
MKGKRKKGKDFSCAAAGPAICPKKQPKEGYDFPCRDLRTSDVVHRNRKKLARFHRKHSPLIGAMPEGNFFLGISKHIFRRISRYPRLYCFRAAIGICARHSAGNTSKKGGRFSD